MTDIWQNKLYYGDNLEILRQYVPNESVDLIYLDPPFNSKATYNVLFAEKNGTASAAQIQAFEDAWEWGLQSEGAYKEVVTEGPKKLANLLETLRGFLGQNDMMAYLTMMAIRLVELHRALKPTGSIYLHCDPVGSHYLKLLMDAVFGPQNFRNEIIWQRTSAHSGSKRWGPVHDVILFYTRSSSFVWNRVLQGYSEEYIERFYRFSDDKGRFRIGDLTGAGTRSGESGQPWRGVNPTDVGRHWAVPNKVLRSLFGDKVSEWTVQEKLDALDRRGLIYWPPKGKVPGFKRYLDEKGGIPIVDVITDVRPIGAHAGERLGYPTQKPEALLERIVKASSNEGDLILDPFCGCGTTVVVAERLKRRWIGIDITHLAINLMKRRLQETFGSDLSPYEVIGEPADVRSAETLANQDRFQFEWWALSTVGARPAQDKKKGADSGVDGYIHFFEASSPDKARKIVVQVKSGKVGVSQVRDLKGVVEREKADIGVFLTLQEPSQPMIAEAAAAGFVDIGSAKYPKIQLLTIREILEEGKRIAYPGEHGRADMTFRKARRQRKTREKQIRFDDEQPKGGTS